MYYIRFVLCSNHLEPVKREPTWDDRLAPDDNYHCLVGVGLREKSLSTPVRFESKRLNARQKRLLVNCKRIAIILLHSNLNICPINYCTVIRIYLRRWGDSQYRLFCFVNYWAQCIITP